MIDNTTLAAPRAAIQAAFPDAVTLLRPSVDVDADGELVGQPDQVGTTTGLLRVLKAGDRQTGTQDGEKLDAHLSCPLGVDIRPGDLVDVRGARWAVADVAGLRTRQVADLTRIATT